MPRKTNKVSTRKSEGFLSQIKWGESYTSLFLGAVVVVIALVLIFSFLKSRSLQNQQTGSASTKETETTYANGMPKSYTVKEGDDLWSISEDVYGSGYNWVDLAEANEMDNPSTVYVGVRLTVPNVAPKELTVSTVMQQPNPITGVSYTVSEGDNLWDIALRAYGDGYKWTQIATSNNLINPNIIHPGNILKLPR